QELFHEFGFRGFAERVRKTLATSGAKKNAAVLAIAGESGRTPSVSEGVTSETPAPSRSRFAGKSGSPSLFDVINEAPESDFAFGANAPADTWSYAGYKLIDTDAAFAAFLKELKKQKRITFDLETT